MYRLFIILMICSQAWGQERLPQLLAAERLSATNPQQAIAVTKSLYTAILKKGDHFNSTAACMQLSSLYGRMVNYPAAVQYDSLSVIHARLSQDSLLMQQTINNWATDISITGKLALAETILDNDKNLFLNRLSKETCRWYEIKAICYFNRMRFDSAILTCRTAQPIALQLQDSTTLMHLQMLIGKFYITTFRPDSVRLLYNALSYFEQKENYRYAAQAANIIGFSFETVNLPDKALVIYDKALDYYNRLNDAREAVQTRMHMGDAYLAKKETDSAKACFLYGYRYFSALHSRKEVSNIAMRLGKIYTDEARFDSAWYYFKTTEVINQQLQSPVTAMGLNVWKAQLLSKQSRYKEADSLMEAGIQMALHVKAELPIPAIEKRLIDKKTITTENTASGNRFAKSQSAVPQPLEPTSGEDYQQMERLNWHTGGNSDTDSTDLEKSQRIVLQVEAEHGVPILKDSLHNEQKSKAFALRNLNRNRLIAVGIIALLLAVAAGSLMYYRKRHKAEQELIQVQSKQSELEVHHRVKGQLGVVSRLIDMAGKSETEKLPVAVLQSRIRSITLIHQLLCDSETITGNINLQMYFSQLCDSLAYIFGTEQSIEVNVDAPREIKSTIAEKLGLLVNELVTNSFKYAFTGKAQGTIGVCAKETKHQLHLTVSDDGCGLHGGKRRKGYGTKLIYGTVGELKGNCSYRNENGTHFDLTIPLKG